MSQDFINIELFDKYVNHELNQSERTDFEQRLKQDTAFAKEFDLFQNMLKGMAYAEEETMKATLAGVQQKLQHENFFSNKQSKIIKMENSNKSSWFKPLAIAASLLVLIAAGFYLFNSGATTSEETNPYANFYKPEKDKLSGILDRLESRGLADPGQGQKDSLARALHQYEMTEYSEALVSLNQYLERYPEDKVAKLYLGLTLLQQSEFAKAAGHLAPLTKETGFEYQSTAKWYLALAYTQFDTPESKENAIKIFKQLTTENAPYSEEAASYLKLYE